MDVDDRDCRTDTHKLDLLKIKILLFLLWLSMISTANANTKLNTEARRIISLAPNLTEILCEVGAAHQIVGRDKYSDYPDLMKKVPIAADYYKLNLERIVKLHPDLVVLEYSAISQAQIERLQKWGIPVYVNHATDLQSIINTTIALGTLSGHQALGQEKAKYFAKLLQSYRKNPKYKIKVFYELWNAPLLTVNEHTVIGQCITLCGGSNIFGKLHQETPKISIETVLKEDPDIIVTSVNKDFWLRWKHLKAVKKGKVFYLAPDVIERTGPRLFVGIQKLSEFIQQGEVL